MAAPVSAAKSGTAKSDPIVARTASGLNGSQVVPTRRTPPAPTASAVRMQVPRLPGSLTPSSASQIGAFAGSSADSGRMRWRNTPMTLCGFSRCGNLLENVRGNLEQECTGLTRSLRTPATAGWSR
jgi:hypothetical protein